jgi:hypothetical protein
VARWARGINMVIIVLLIEEKTFEEALVREASICNPSKANILAKTLKESFVCW